MAGTSGRLLALLSLLQARRDWPGSLLAERLEVSERTVRRDVGRLRDLGYPITATKGPDGGYRLGAGADLPPLLLDDEQAVALAVALRSATASGTDIGEAAGRALATLRQVMPSRLRHRVDAVELSSAAPSRGARPAADPAVLATLAAAVRAREVVRFDHGDPGNHGDPDDRPGVVRRVEPHHVVSRAGRWYLVGWDLDRDDWRVFGVDRVRPRVPHGPRFTPRPLPGDGSVASFLTGRFRGAVAGEDWPCRGEVVLHLPLAQVAPFALDGAVEALGPDRTRLAVGSWSWAGLVALLARFDADLEVVGPPELAAALDRVGRRLVDAGGRGSAQN
ncbi:helix-turn-helix transcriptional regulator [Nocardioides marmotae]|uniref:helix-turn-helix transcriptional regulator n=1 Tax=Nocardioides marmotae TaxID=2663857 RepID=UPI0012B5D9FE|nr:WYL domain-containing protein [Nocardioides marmotae]MBC9735169.1 WYL domain-containing protein [Nocardioides marmotae]MTB86269.1 WYL domain-containing protein [Nocardioides marmotae]